MGDLVAEYGVRHLSLVSGRQSFALCGAEAQLARLLPAGVQVRRFSDFQRNPTVEDVERGIAWLREEPGDLLLAIGGGSVIDTAKVINTLSTLTISPRDAVLGGVVPTRAALPLVAVPTTAGTGSEATRFAALYVDGIKHSLDHPCLLPAAAIVDPQLVRSMPPALAACAGLDALCQAIESYWAVRATVTSRDHARRAIGLLLPHLRAAVRDGVEEAYGHLSEGAWYAGRAIDISRTTAAHALSYPLTQHAGLPHGHAVALTLPYFIRFNGMGCSRALQAGIQPAALDRTLEELWALLGCANARQAAEQFELLVRSLGLPTTLAERRLDSTLVERMAREISLQRLGNNPVIVSADEVSEAYARLM